MDDAVTTPSRSHRAATVRFAVVDPTSTAARSAIQQYFDELDERFRHGFDPHEGGAATDDTELTAPRGAFVVATSDESIVGCGGVHRIDGTTAEIKRMWIHREWRGLGLGARLLARLELQCGELGCTAAVLDTNESLTEAVAMYQRAGYEVIEQYNDNPYAHHWFRKQLT